MSTHDQNLAPAPSITLRRILFFGATLLLTALGSFIFVDLLIRVYGALSGPSALLVAVFTLLFLLLSFGFTMVLTGVFAARQRRFNLTNSLDEKNENADLDLTAIVFPIYNEEVAEVFARVRQTYFSLQKTGRLDRFEFFILSDSTSSDVWLEEEDTWARLCRDLDAFGRIFYRHRALNTNSKAGNIADFCRGWGGRYSYMVVMDADSFMEGGTVVKLARLMQQHPKIGIIQTTPRLIGAESLFGRIQQFSNQAYGSMFTAGLNFWQGSEGNYWGHNAIIRVQPFTEYCGLPDLPGKAPFGGKILSHDFVEAALMRKAGWEVWLAWDLGGSFEEGPESLIAYAQRDRRWLQGNIQHGWLLFAKGLHPMSKLHLATGILGYLASPLWLGFLFLSSIVVYRQQRSGLSLVPANGMLNNLFPDLTVAGQAWMLLGLTALMLFAPKILFFLRAVANPQLRRSFGGLVKITGGILCELIFSTLLAPILMLLHTKFLVSMFSGLSVRWGAQPRGATGTPWPAAFRAHLGHTVLGILWTLWAIHLGWGVFLWSLPVLLGLVISIPLSKFTSSPDVGRLLRRTRLLGCPDEKHAPPSVRDGRNEPRFATASFTPYHGFSRAVVDPYLNAIHVALLDQPSEIQPPLAREISEILINEGPGGLGEKDLKAILQDGETLLKLHRRIWSSELMTVAPWWRRVITHYRR